MQKEDLIQAIRQRNLFDDGFYFEQLLKLGPEYFQGDRTLIEHYLEIGFFQGLRPHPEFDPRRYLREHPELAASKQNPLAHFVMGSARDARPAPLDAPVKALAFYLPQFHPIPENDAWWGKGFSEWTNVVQARPQFPGHNQPRLPADLGFYDLRLPEARAAQAELARSYGLHGFCYYYYWFAGKRLLERPLDGMLQSGEPDFPFCLCWANENWSRRWDGGDSDILIAQEHSPENDVAFSESLVPYFDDRRYIRVRGRPMLIVYRPDALPDLKGTLERWREHFRRRGIGEVYLVAALTFGFHQGIEAGFDAEVQFPPHSVHMPNHASSYDVEPDFSGSIFRYSDMVAEHIGRAAPGRTRFFTVMLEWDNCARKKHAAHIFDRFTLDEYEQWLRASVVKTRELYPPDERFVFINAWNEWAEGTYLEPDRKRGLGYLESTKRALAGLDNAPLDFQVRMLDLFPPADQAAAEARISRVLEQLPPAGPLPASITALFAPRQVFSVAGVDYPPVEETMAWIESIRRDEPLTETGLFVAGWVISRRALPALIEVSIEDQLEVEMQITGTRHDVFKHHEAFWLRGPNLFSLHLPLASISAFARWKSAPVVRLRIIGQDGSELIQIGIRLRVTSAPCALASLAAARGPLAVAAAHTLQRRFLHDAPVLFVMHDLYPAGAQLFLTRFLAWLRRAAPDLPFEVLVVHRRSELPRYGEHAASMCSELEAIAEVHWLDEGSALPANLAQIEAGRYSLYYLNSLATLRHPYTAINLLGSAALLHVHELDFTAASLLSDEQIDRLRASGAQALACSAAVSEMLSERIELPRDRTHLLHAFAPVEKGGRAAAGERGALRRELEITPEAPIILLVGSVNWRKGAYLLSGVARALGRMFAASELPYFVWVGATGEVDTARHLEREFELVGLGPFLRLTGHREDVRRFYDAADVFLLASIEDPFPLVMIEAGAAGLPVVAFAGTGGAAEFIAADGGGIAAARLDTQQMAVALYRLLSDRELRDEMGRQAQLSAHRFSLEVNAPRLRDLILRQREAAFERRLGLA